jgi:nucleoid-associated protein YgaU
MRRYGKTARIKGGKQLATAHGCNALYHACRLGIVATNVRIVKQGERLDVIAAKSYGSSHLWWIIAAASGIGWGMQIPPGTVLKIPINLSEVDMYVG